MAEYKRDPDREFTCEIKRQEKVAANYQCRICGAKKSVQPLECAHIYTLTTSDLWERSGGDKKTGKSNDHVKSVCNCLLLFKFHHERIDSPEGLKRADVAYLESLKRDLTTCTALVKDGNNWRRCKAKNSRKDGGGNYRCHKHASGGLENTLPVRKFIKSHKKLPKAEEQKSGWCVIC